MLVCSIFISFVCITPEKGWKNTKNISCDGLAFCEILPDGRDQLQDILGVETAEHTAQYQLMPTGPWSMPTVRCVWVCAHQYLAVLVIDLTPLLKIVFRIMVFLNVDSSGPFLMLL